MSKDSLLTLAAGTPVIMVETAIDCESEHGIFLAELPKVHAGRLAEPHCLDEGMGPCLLMEGPLARSLAPDTFDSRIVLWSDEGETMMLFISQEGEETMRIRWVLEDTKGLLDELETDTFTWDAAETVRDRLYQRVIETFAFLVVNSFAMTPFLG